MAEAPKKRRKVTLRTLMRKMREGEQIVQMAIYDYRSAVIADDLGVDILCVSDTGGMILFGHQSTVTVTFDEVMMMAKAIDRGSRYGLRMVDMPYWSFHTSAEQAVEKRRALRARGERRGDEVRGQPASRAERRGDRQGGRPGPGPHRHHPHAHRPDSAASSPRARPRTAPASWSTTRSRSSRRDASPS